MDTKSDETYNEPLFDNEKNNYVAYVHNDCYYKIYETNSIQQCLKGCLLFVVCLFACLLVCLQFFFVQKINKEQKYKGKSILLVGDSAMDELTCYLGQYLATPYIDTNQLNQSDSIFYNFFDNEKPHINNDDFQFQCVHGKTPATFYG